MKTNIIKIGLLVLALGVIVFGISLMIKQGTNRAPETPHHNDVFAMKADTLVNRYTQGGDSMNYHRAMHFNELCRRENKINVSVYNTNLSILVSDTANRVCDRFAEIESDTTLMWYANILRKSISSLDELYNKKLYNSSNSAMNDNSQHRKAHLHSIMQSYDACTRAYRSRFGDEYSVAAASSLLNRANQTLRDSRYSDLLKRNINLQNARSSMPRNLEIAHREYIKGLINGLKTRRFATKSNLQDAVSAISVKIADYNRGSGIYPTIINLVDDLEAAESEASRYNGFEISDI